METHHRTKLGTINARQTNGKRMFNIWQLSLFVHHKITLRGQEPVVVIVHS